MIKYTKDNTIELLLEKFPEFWPEWREHLEFWGDEERNFGNDIMPFTDFAEDAIKQNNSSLIKRIMEQIEDLLVNGDQDVEYQACLGIIESIISGSRKIPPKNYYNYTGPRTREVIIELDKGWGKRTPYFWSDKEIEEFNRNKN
jgi:hypothetical protein